MRAKRAHDDLLAAVWRAQADALLIEAQAKIRLANEYDAAQARGEVANGRDGPGAGVVDGNAKATAAQLSLRRDELHEARQLRNAERDAPGIIRAVILERLDAGEEPTKAAMRAALVSRNTGNQEWFTPAPIIEAVRAVMGGIDLDPASCAEANRTVRATRFYSASDDGLSQPWPIGRIWLNPPYSAASVAAFTARFVTECAHGSTGIALTNNATETQWWQRLASAADAICFPSGRIRFTAAHGIAGGAPLQGQSFIYIGPDSHRFREVFSRFGIVI